MEGERRASPVYLPSRQPFSWMFARLCMVVEEIMPDGRRREWGPDIVEFDRRDDQFVLVGTTLDEERLPVVSMSVLEKKAASLGITLHSDMVRVNGADVPVRVTYRQYLDQAPKLLITYRLAEGEAPEGRAREVVGWVVRAMDAGYT